MNYQAMGMEFWDPKGRKVVPRGMTNGGPRTITTQQMEVIPKKGEVTCIIACRSTSNYLQSNKAIYEENDKHNTFCVILLT